MSTNQKSRLFVFRMGRAAWGTLILVVGITSSVLALAQLKFSQLSIGDGISQAGIASAIAAGGGVLSENSMVYVSSYAYNKSPVQSQNPPLPWGNGDPITGSINGWSGRLVAVPVITDANGQLTVAVNSDGSRVNDAAGWTATIPATRNIFTAGPGAFQPGITFTDDNLRDDPSGIANATVNTVDTVNVVRHNPLGDIVDSQIAFVGSGRSGFSSDSTYATFSNYLGGIHRKNVVYVGANDGMLHGFDAGQDIASTQQERQGSGVELMAYVPRGLLGLLGSSDTDNDTNFDNPKYSHRFWVDGSPFSGDARINPKQSTDQTGGWATVLVGALGAGGPGYFVLDVTDPGNFSGSTNAKNLVLMDATDPSNGSLARQLDQMGRNVTGYIGSQFNQPVMDVSRGGQSAQIVQINSALADANTAEGKYLPEWAVIMGNGYNSDSGLPVLLIQSLSQRESPSQQDSQGPLKIYTVPATCYSNGNRDRSGDTCRSAGNGLGAPRAVDVDGNGTVDVVYAGDLMGNLWKFDISSPDHTQWGVAKWGESSDQPLFAARGPTGPIGAAQAITSAPMVVANPVHGGYMVAFGTGRNLTDDDASDASVNSIYAIWDNEIPTEDNLYSIPGTKIIVPQVKLDDDNFKSFCAPGSGSARYPCLYQQIDSAPPNPGLDSTNVRGWYYDLPAATKVLANPLLLTDNILLFYAKPNTGGSDSSPTLHFFYLFTGNVASITDGTSTGEFTFQSSIFAPSPDKSTPETWSFTGNVQNVAGSQSSAIYVLNGSKGVLGLGGKSSNISITPQTSLPRSVGWRFGR
jgi:hypothetical protein